MGRNRQTWGHDAESILSDGARRGLTALEIHVALLRRGVRGASLATVKRRLAEVRGRPASRGPIARPPPSAPAKPTPSVPVAPPRAPLPVAVVNLDYAFEGDPGAIVATALARLAPSVGFAPRSGRELFSVQLPERADVVDDAILSFAAPDSIAYLALYATEDERHGREADEGDDEHDAFLEAHEADHLARARKLLRDALSAIPSAHASIFTVRTEEKTI